MQVPTVASKLALLAAFLGDERRGPTLLLLSTFLIETWIGFASENKYDKAWICLCEIACRHAAQNPRRSGSGNLQYLFRTLLPCVEWS